jgi:hypothetical protein
MDIAKLIAHLRRELELVNQAIHSLEPLVPAPRRRGRPRKRLSVYLYRPRPGVAGEDGNGPGRRASGKSNSASGGSGARPPELGSNAKDRRND